MANRRQVLALLAGLAAPGRILLAQSGSPAPGATRLPPWAPAPGTRANISRNLLRDVDPCPSRDCGYSGSGGQRAVLGAWCGGAFATDWSALGGYLAHGGGHGDYWGNEVYVFDLNTLLWQRLSEPYEPSPGAKRWITRDQPLGPTGDLDEGEYAAGIPASSHTYDNVQYLPAALAGNRRGHFIRLTGTSNGTLGGGYSGRSHAFDLDARRWARFSLNRTTAAEGGNGGAATCFDARRARFWSAGLGAHNVTRFLDVKSRTWSTAAHPPRQGHNFRYDISGAYHEAFDLFVVLYYRSRGDDPDRSSLWAMNCGKPEEGWRQLTTEGPRPLKTGPGLEWCPPLRCFVAYEGQGASRVLKLHPPEADPFARTWTWEGDEIAGDAPIGRTGGGPHYSRFCWAPAARCFIWADARDQAVQAWRLRGT